MAFTSPFKRVQQWNVMSRLWYLYDAQWQNPYESAETIAKYLLGKHKPVYHAHSDCGDHVVVINTRDIALPNDEWMRRVYFHHTGYPGGASWTLAWELHSKKPTLVMEKAVYRAVGNSLLRHPAMARLHCYPDAEVPPDILTNVNAQMKQLRPVPKRLTEYSKEDVAEFPKVFDWPRDYVLPRSTQTEK